MISFFRELKQRRIVQVLGSYLVTGWVALEVVGALVERAVLPEIAYGLGLVTYVGGLCATLVLGWYHGEKGRQHFTRFEVAILAVIGGVTLFMGYRTWQDDARQRASERLAVENAENLNRVAVLYLKDRSPDADLGYLADGLTEALHQRLGDVQGLDLVSQSGSSRYRDSDLPTDSIARLLDAGIVIEGSVEPRGDDVRVSLSLLDGAGGAELYRSRIDHPATDVFALQEDLEEEVLDRLRTWLGDEIAVRTARRGTDVRAAWADYQRGQRARREADQALDAGDIEGFIEAWQSADGLLESASEADPGWARPPIIRALLASRWAELSAYESREEAAEYFNLALERLRPVIQDHPREALGHQAWGTVQYLRWVTGVVDDPDAAARLLDDARTSLERAVALDDRLAHAWNLLSIVSSEQADMVGANMAARQALAADEFLRSAEAVLVTLYGTSYDLENLRDARTYCEQGRRQYPENATFAQCSLWLMGAGAVEPDIDAAWDARDRYLSLLPETERPREEISSRLLVAQVVAEASARTGDSGLADSARAIVAGSQVGPTVDPSRELLGLEALVHLRLGDAETAIDRLGVYLTASPSHRDGWRWTSHWWWRPLQGDPRFRSLIGR